MARVTIYEAAALAVAAEQSVKGRTVIAEAAAAAARSSAPVESGEYRDGVGTRVDGDEVAIVNSDPEAFYKEYGTVDTPAHMSMTNAARKFGRYTGLTGRGR